LKLEGILRIKNLQVSQIKHNNSGAVFYLGGVRRALISNSEFEDIEGSKGGIFYV
jgi:hypothetical protein